jgi:hypothetical protein
MLIAQVSCVLQDWRSLPQNRDISADYFSFRLCHSRSRIPRSNRATVIPINGRYRWRNSQPGTRIVNAARAPQGRPWLWGAP